MAQDYKTMRVPEDAHEIAKESKREKETWGEFLQRCSNNPPETREFVDAEEIAERIRTELPTHDAEEPNYDDIRQAVRTIEERTNQIESMLEDMGAIR